MRAVRAHARGGPERLVNEDAPRPDPGPGEVLVAVKAASITPGELTWAETWTNGDGEERTPIIPAHEFSGVVEGSGDAVYGLIPFTSDGAAAEYVTVAADVLAPKPESIDHEQAAALPLAALSAWQALVDHADLRSGQHVLVHGAAGGVGVYVVQIAKALGAHVTATASAKNADFVRDLGAEDVIDYTHDRFEDRVHDVDVVVDLVGGDTQQRSWSVLRPGGVLVSLAAPPDEEGHAAAKGVYFVVEPDRDGLSKIADLVDSGRVKPVVDRVVPLEETRAAYEALEERGRRGKIVISVSRNGR